MNTNDTCQTIACKKLNEVCVNLYRTRARIKDKQRGVGGVGGEPGAYLSRQKTRKARQTHDGKRSGRGLMTFKPPLLIVSNAAPERL